jgi:hypothetical protein
VALDRKVGTQHRVLESLLRSMAAAARDADAVRARERLDRLRRALDAHFVLEEAHYFPERRSTRPDLAPELAALADEHGLMRGELERIGRHVEGSAWSDARRAIRALERTFREHERVETALLASAQDPGCTAPSR